MRSHGGEHHSRRVGATGRGGASRVDVRHSPYPGPTGFHLRPVSLLSRRFGDVLSGEVRPALLLDPVSMPAPESGLGSGARGGRRDDLSLENRGVF